jgi:hypothetical protein
MKKPNYDLSRKKCHACGAPIHRDMKRGVEFCSYFSCRIKNVEFTIPFVQEGEE